MKCPQHFSSQGVRGKSFEAKNFGVLIWINKVLSVKEGMFPIGFDHLFVKKYKDVRLYLRISHRHILEINIWYDADRSL